MPKDLKPKTLRLQWSDMTAVVWRDKTDIGLLKKTFTIHPQKAIIIMNIGTQ
jgi:hypothetical protein